MGDEEAWLATLEEVVRDEGGVPEDRLRAAADLLVEDPHVPAIRPLVAAGLAATDSDVVAAALDAAACLGPAGAEYLPAVRAMTLSPERGVRERARAALRAIEGRE